MKHSKKRLMRAVATGTMVAATVVIATGCGLNLSGKDTFRAYAKAPYEQTSENFELMVEGQKVDVVTYFDGRYDYAHIAYDGTASFEISALNGNIQEYDLSPHSYNITGEVADDKLTFELAQDGSRYLILELTAGEETDMLVIAADPMDTTEKPKADGKNVVDVTQAPYNADNTGETNASPAIQQAIDNVSAAGGGTVYVPAGVYKFVYIDARDNVTLYLDEGAHLRGSGDRNDYKWNDSGSNGRQGRRSVDLNDAENFAIIGRGVIDANSIALVEPGDDGVKDGWDDFRKGIIDADGAQNITLEGITVKDATAWTFSIEKSKNITCKNIKMLNDFEFVHSDGYDFVSCQDVLVEDCLGICGDDVFCPKASHEGYEMKNYLFKDSVAFATGGAGCKVGMQAREKTSNIEFNNIDVVRGYRGITVAHDDGSGDFEDIRFIDIRSEKLKIGSIDGQFRSAPFVFWTLDKNNNGAIVSDIEVTNCSFENYGKLKGLIMGNIKANSYVDGVTFTNLRMNGTLVTEENYKDFVTHGPNIDNIKYLVEKDTTQ